MELKFFTEFLQLREIRAFIVTFLPLKFDRKLTMDRSQLLAEVGDLLFLFECFPTLSRGELVQLCIEIIERTKFLDELCGCFLSDAGNARDIVGAIPHES